MEIFSYADIITFEPGIKFMTTKNIFNVITHLCCLT